MCCAVQLLFSRRVPVQAENRTFLVEHCCCYMSVLVGKGPAGLYSKYQGHLIFSWSTVTSLTFLNCIYDTTTEDMCIKEAWENCLICFEAIELYMMLSTNYVHSEYDNETLDWFTFCLLGGSRRRARTMAYVYIRLKGTWVRRWF